MCKINFLREKCNFIIIFVLCCAILFLFNVDCLSMEEDTKKLTDIIPYDTIAYLSVSKLDSVAQNATHLPEWKELYSIEDIKEGLEQAENLLTMLLGLTPEEFVNTFGNKSALCFLGIENEMPIFCFAVDASKNKDDARYALEQLISFAALNGKMVMEENMYREVPYTTIKVEDLKVDYGFLGNFILAGINGGFEKMVELYKDGGNSIEDNPNFQFIGKKTNMSHEAYLFVNIEQIVPIWHQLQKIMNKDKPQSEEDKEFNEFLENFIFPSVKGVGISLSLSGIAHEAYVYVKPNDENPLFKLLLSPHPTMTSIKFLPVDGMLAAIQLGEPGKMFDSLLDVAKFFGKDMGEFEKQIHEMEKGFGINLREDLLSSLTGEIAVMGLLPMGEVNLKKNKLDFAKFRPIILLGVKDKKRLEKTVSKVMEIVQFETQKMGEEDHRDTKIYTKAVPLNMLVPGAAFMPAYAYKNDLLIISNSAMWVKDAIDMLDELRQNSLPAEVKNQLTSSWILAFMDAGEILDFLNQQKLIEEMDLPEKATEKLRDFGTVTLNYSAENDGIGIGIFSEKPWIEEIVRVVLLGIYSEQAKKEKINNEKK